MEKRIMIVSKALKENLENLPKFHDDVDNSEFGIENLSFVPYVPPKPDRMVSKGLKHWIKECKKIEIPNLVEDKLTFARRMKIFKMQAESRITEIETPAGKLTLFTDKIESPIITHSETELITLAKRVTSDENHFASVIWKNRR